MSSSTLGTSLTTRDTVARETPASAATISRVGVGRFPLVSCFTFLRSVVWLAQVPGISV
jgi:hypothetical protein